MALARSASVPGGLSINTGAANLFSGSSTATSQPAASGGLFGSATAAAKPATASLFGTPAATTAAATATTAAPAAGTSLFGGAATAVKPAGGGLFGGGATTTTTTATGGGLFGASTAQPAASTAGGLFGASTAAAQPAAAATGGGLFGASTAKPAATGGGLFGASTAQPAAAATGGGLFGASTAQPAAATTGGGLFGASTAAATQLTQTQTQQTIPGVRIDLSNLRGTTRFNDLQESLQQDVITFDTMVQSYMGQKNQVEAFLPAHGESLEAIPGDVRFVARKYDGVSAASAADLQAIQGLREMVRHDADNAQLSFKALDNQKLPASFRTSGLWSTAQGQRGGARDDDDNDNDITRGSGGTTAAAMGGTAGAAAAGRSGRASDLVNYFSRTGDDIEQQLRKLEANLGEIEVHMYSVQAGLLEQLQRVAASGTAASAAAASHAAGVSGTAAAAVADVGFSADHKVAELAAVLRDFEESILSVASVVGSAREDMTSLQLGAFLGRR